MTGDVERVTGIGGIFFQAKDPVALRAWYRRHLGIDVQAWGGTAFRWTDSAGNPVHGTTIWSIGEAGRDGTGPTVASLAMRGVPRYARNAPKSAAPTLDARTAHGSIAQARRRRFPRTRRIRQGG